MKVPVPSQLETAGGMEFFSASLNRATYYIQTTYPHSVPGRNKPHPRRRLILSHSGHGKLLTTSGYFSSNLLPGSWSSSWAVEPLGLLYL